MSKIDLMELPFEDAVTEVRKLVKNRIKSGQDPFTSTYNVCKKFIVEEFVAKDILRHLRAANARYSSYIEL